MLKNKVSEKFEIPCPMCKKALLALSENRFILRCNHCSITFAVDEIIEQAKMSFVSLPINV